MRRGIKLAQKAGASPARPDERFLRRRRAVRSQRWRGPLLVFAAVALIAGAGWAVFVSPLLTLQHVDVTGAGTSEVARLTPEKVRAQVDVPADTPLARLDLDDIVGAVEDLPSVASATAERDWPSSVTVSVVERRPVAAIEAHGAWRALDVDGVIFGAYRRLPGGLPQVSAGAAEAAERESALAEAAAVVTALEPAIAARVSTVEARSRDDVVLQLSSGEQVRWGSAEDSAVKARVLTVLLRVPAVAYDVSVPELPTTSQNALETAPSTPADASQGDDSMPGAAAPEPEPEPEPTQGGPTDPAPTEGVPTDSAPTDPASTDPSSTESVPAEATPRW